MHYIPGLTRRVLFTGLLLLAISCMTPAAATADGPGACTDWVAILVSAEGQVEARYEEEGLARWHPVSLNDRYCAGDELRTLENSRAALQLRNDTIVRLDQSSMVKFVPVEPDVPLLLRLFSGRAFFLSRHPRPLTIETPFLNAASGGTEYLIEIDEATGATTLIVIEGVMHLSNPAGRLTVGAGESSVTRAGEAPAPHLAVRPRDVLQWALHYPPVLSLRELRLDMPAMPDPLDWRRSVQASIDAYHDGDLKGAFNYLREAPDDIDDPRFYAHRASLLLSVGRIDEARADIAQSLALAPGNGLARALESLIAVVLNAPEQALELALGAASTEPDSPSVRLALSYAWQANLNLPEALAAAQAATRLDPDSALAWARVAELWMSQGYLNEALAAARRAEALNPREARFHTVVGFAHLTRIEISAATAAFEAAIAIDSADPLPRLGLGLAKIRKGNLAEGRTDIEIAAALDPANALIRSYLGKAYYEEKRNPQAAAQFDLAKDLDPMDPTPYMYDALRKQTVNRPVEAMRDLQESVSLNDNRAIYRSRLLLDNDLATRNVSQGRIYTDLGFSQAGLVEGWKSVNIDPANHSAHRFLADSYAAIPRSDVARLSSLLVSQLLQPVNTNPVQPRLGDRAQVLSVDAGSALPSFNEYSQLFVRDRTRLLASGVVGGNDTWGEEVIISGLHGRFSYSLGQSRYETDGYRPNADISETDYNVFAQATLAPSSSVQAEYRYHDSQSGDLDLRFDRSFIEDFRRDMNIETWRVGLRHGISPRSNLIVSALHQDARDDVEIPSAILTLDSRNKGTISEAQHLFRGERVNTIIGAGYYDGERVDEGSVLGFIPLDSETDYKNTNVYLYSMIRYPLSVSWTLGINHDSLDHSDSDEDRDRTHPKFGIIWDVTSSTTFRLAALRATRRPIVSDQTIEPTQVAGFQQFFDDPFGTEYERYGAGIDWKISPVLLSGAEFAKREVDTPVFLLGERQVIESEEHTGRAYLAWAPDDRIAVRFEYLYESADADDISFSPFPDLKTHRGIVGINYYHPGGFFARLELRYIDQKITSFNVSTESVESGSDDFWLTNAAIGYRIPGRRGMVALQADNLFDRDFRFHDVIGRYPEMLPERIVFGRLTLSF
jgi:tetratricopeptide (TPR) repeat protein